MPEHQKHTTASTARTGAVSPKVIVTAATLLLSVCASVFTFMLLTRIETWMAERREANYQYEPVNDNPAVNNVEAADDGYGAETNAYETSNDIVTDEPRTPPPSQTSYTQPYTSPYTSAYTQPYTPQPFPPPNAYMIDNASPDAAYFALTFDGGSLANAADDILDTLASRGVRSTMFLTGAFIRRYPDVVIKIAEMGHELGNHTATHPRLTTYADDRTQTTRANVTRQSVAGELENAARALADRTGLRFVPLWRAPYGEYNPQICRWALEAGYVHIGWRQGGSWARNLDTNDWVPDEGSPGYRSPEEVMRKIVGIASQPRGLNGGIILMHLGTERKIRSQQVHIILGKLIDTLRGMGYEPVTVSELLYVSGIDVAGVGQE
jgi:peptidoglycan/xylan/chitin deacetylase (PgdA/CDA1 family)